MRSAARREVTAYPNADLLRMSAVDIVNRAHCALFGLIFLLMGAFTAYQFGCLGLPLFLPALYLNIWMFFVSGPRHRRKMANVRYVVSAESVQMYLGEELVFAVSPQDRGLVFVSAPRGHITVVLARNTVGVMCSFGYEHLSEMMLFDRLCPWNYESYPFMQSIPEDHEAIAILRGLNAG